MTDTTDTADAEGTKPTLTQKVLQELREWGATLAIFIPVFLVFTTFAFELRSIPSESMLPGLQVHDRVAVNKFAYGYSRHSVAMELGRFLPLGPGRVFGKTPERGDVVVFMHPHFNRVMIKRAIGLPGDTVQMRGERLFINGQEVPTEYLGTRTYVEHAARGRQAFTYVARVYEETLPNGVKVRVEHIEKDADVDTTPVFHVPEGHVLFMGDNRDRSLDGRNTRARDSGHCPVVDGAVREAGCPLPAGMDPERASIGFVPLENLIGRAETVFFTLNFCRDRAGHECPPGGRVWRGL